MDLKTYLKTLDPGGRRRFAELAGTKPSYLPHLAGGHRRPSAALAVAINRASKGKVDLSTLRPDIFEARQ